MGLYFCGIPTYLYCQQLIRANTKYIPVVCYWWKPHYKNPGYAPVEYTYPINKTYFYRVAAWIGGHTNQIMQSLAEEATESKGGHFAKLKWFSIAKITFLRRGLKFKRGHAPLFPPPINLQHLLTTIQYNMGYTIYIWQNFWGQKFSFHSFFTQSWIFSCELWPCQSAVCISLQACYHKIFLINNHFLLKHKSFPTQKFCCM